MFVTTLAHGELSPIATASTFATQVPFAVTWTLAPQVLAGLASYALIYGWRWRQARREGGSRAASRARAALWTLGVAILFIALVSPLDSLGEKSAAAHMVQHLLIADLAPVALTLGLTKWLLRPVMPTLLRVEKALGPFGHPAFGVVAYVGAMYFWHIPTFYDAAVRNDVVHAFEHLTFLSAGLLYWWHLLSPVRSRLRLSGPAAVIYMAATKVFVGFLGMVLAFSPSLLFSAYKGTTAVGLSALDDQHVAGVIMALEQSVVMGVALAYLFVRMLREADAADVRADRFEIHETTQPEKHRVRV